MNNKALLDELAKNGFTTTTEIEKDGKTYTQHEWNEQTNTQILLAIYKKLDKLLNIIITLIALGVIGAILAIIGIIK